VLTNYNATMFLTFKSSTLYNNNSHTTGTLGGYKKSQISEN